MSIIAVAAMMLVSCKKDNGDDNKGKDDNKTVETVDWSVIGTINGDSWAVDIAMTKDGDIYAAKGVTLAANDEFKLRYQKAWEANRGGTFVALGKPFAVEDKGANIKPGLEGTYDIYYNAAEELMEITEANATPDWTDPAPVTIDGDMSDWESIEGITEGCNTLKAISDANNIYLYSKRASTGRYNDIWNGTGYVYFGFDLDNNSETGDGEKADWNTGKWETLILTYPYAGTADAKAMATEMSSSWWVLPSTFTIANLTFKGAVEEDGAAFEVCIPRSDIAAVPTTQITIKSWGNKDLSSAVLECTL